MTEKKYDAFINYSRKDKIFASLIEKELKNYTPPKDKDIPQQRLKIFRDEEDFTGTEYYESANKHLRASRKLVLICSPAARASHFVNEEIPIFAKANGGENIIPILLEGVLNNEAPPEQAANMAFPDTLLEVLKKTSIDLDTLFEVKAMPLANCDYRSFKPGKNKVNKGEYDKYWFILLAELYGIDRSVIKLLVCGIQRLEIL